LVAALKGAALRLPRLKEVRELHGWSQKKLAEESGVSRDSISNYETGHRDAWPATAKKLADALGVEIADLREPSRELALPKADAPPAGLEIPELVGLDVALRRRGMGRGELAYRAGMTPGELFDYEVGAKKPDEEIVTRLADALGCFRAELIFAPEQAEDFLAEERQQNAVIRNKADEWLQEMREELIRNPVYSRTRERMKEAFRKEGERRASEPRRKDDTAS